MGTDEKEINSSADDALENASQRFQNAEKEYEKEEASAQLIENTTEDQEEEEENQEQYVEQSTENALQNQAPQRTKKESNDPRQELVDELSNFVAQTNKQITEFFQDKGKGALQALKSTGPMQALDAALDNAKQFAKDKVNQGVGQVSESAAAVREQVDAMKARIRDAFSHAMNSAANAIASRMHKGAAPKPEKGVEPDAQPTRDSQASSDAKVSTSNRATQQEQVRMSPPSDGVTTPINASGIDNVDPGQHIEENNTSPTPRSTPDGPKDGSGLTNPHR